jgi:hypothetical protein
MNVEMSENHINSKKKKKKRVSSYLFNYSRNYEGKDLIFWGNYLLTPMNYKALAICPHELPSAIPDPIKLPNTSQQPPSVSQLR